MHSAYHSHGPSAPDPLSAIAASIAAAKVAASENQDRRAPSRKLREVDRIIRALPSSDQFNVAVKACELLLAEGNTTGIVKTLHRLDENYRISETFRSRPCNLAGLRLAEAVSSGSLGWIRVLKRFSPPIEPKNPSTQRLIKDRFVKEAKAGRTQDALYLRRQFPEVIAALSSDRHFVIAELQLIPQLAGASDVGSALPRFTQELFPLPTELTQRYMQILLETYKNCIYEVNWNGAMAVLRCAAPDNNSTAITPGQRAEFFEQLRDATLRAINSAIDGEMTLEQIIKSQSQSTKLRDLASEVISEGWIDELTLPDRLRTASRRIICEHARSAEGVAETITVISKLAASFSLFGTQPEELPNGRRVKRWVAGRLREVGESLWYLAEFGSKADYSPRYLGVDSRTYENFLKVKDLAGAVFRLEPLGVPDARSIKHWRIRYELRNSREHFLDRVQDNQSRSGFVDGVLDRLRTIDLYNRTDRMLHRGNHEHALPLAEELLRVTVSNPNCRIWLGGECMERLPKMFASACRSPENAAGMLSQILLQELRRGGADRELLRGVSNELARLYRLQGYNTRADAMQQLSKEILGKQSGFNTLESSIRRAGLGRRWRGVRP